MILQTLGIEDFGIYNLVGGLVASFSFVSNSIISANSRFLSFSIGLKNDIEVNKTFTQCLTSSLLIAIFVVLLCESVGLWWLINKLNVPEGKLDLSILVFHLSIVNLFFLLLFTPFHAIIIAYEKMKAYAVITIVGTLINFGAVLFLKFHNFPIENVLLYSYLLIIVNIILSLIFLIFVKRNFKHVDLKFKFDKGLKSLFSYSSWDLYGNLSVTARTSGIALVQNMFFGVGINAAIGIANQVQNIVNQFSSNILFASKPQVIKSFASGDESAMLTLINKTTKYSTLLLCIIIIPLLVEMDFILKFWLGVLPAHTSSFVSWFLLFVIAANVSQCILMGIHATGKIKKSSLINGTIYLLVIPITFYGFRNGYSPAFPYIVNVILVVLGGVFNAIYLKSEIAKFNISNFYLKSVIPVIVLSITNFWFLSSIKKYFTNQYVEFFSIAIISVVIMSLFAWYLIIEKNIKKVLIDKIQSLWRKS
ncbi:hypothetical protein C4F49_01525 [Sphingobacterium sp. KB22]|uniref:Na+-driven multidrug efflux pump n=1 Tax=Sphingobacterium hungaricum TaxID=2082723 RepID=A0A928YNS3_9SPHI|nr:hypothetical protein [Sphingobacterium hungaricum]